MNPSPNSLFLVLIWAWMHAHPHASFDEFNGAVSRSLKLLERRFQQEETQETQERPL